MLQPDPVLTRINGMWDLYLPPHRAAREEWAKPEGWEKKRLEYMAVTVGCGDVVYDIGAEEGDMSALYAQCGADVVLVEPNPLVWSNIKYVWEANGLRAPLLCWSGFAGPPEQVRPGIGANPAHGWPDAADGPLLSDHGFLNLHERPDVQATTIDWIATLTQPPTVITMDVEGAEFEVLRGARTTLIMERPHVFVSLHRDFMEQTWGYRPEALFAWMEALGYTAECIDKPIHEEHWVFRPVAL